MPSPRRPTLYRTPGRAHGPCPTKILCAIPGGQSRPPLQFRNGRGDVGIAPYAQHEAAAGRGVEDAAPLRNSIIHRCVGADAPVHPPNLYRPPCKKNCHCEGAPRPWQSVLLSPSPRKKEDASRHPLFYTLESLENYFSSTLAPTSSSCFFMFSASSLDRASFRVVGVSSTAFLASARPRPVISRTDLMTLIF